MLERSVVSWNSVITACVENSWFSDGIEYFVKMRGNGFEPDETTMVVLLSACAEIGNLSLGKCVHSHVIGRGLVVNCKLGTSLVDMYAKSGALDYAKLLFDRLKERNVWTWSAMILGLAQHGFAEEALALFAKMMNSSISPNYVTFLGVLSACNHAGLVEEGQNFFHSMCMSYHIQPNIEHCGCIIDMLARSGRLEEAVKFVRNLPVGPNAVIRRMLINACKVHRDFDIGLSLIRGLKTFSHSPENHVISSNLLAEAGMWDDVLDERSLMVKQKVLKVAGKSLISELT